MGSIGFDAFGSMYGNMNQWALQERVLSHNKKMQREAQEWQTGEREAQNSWNERQTRAANAEYDRRVADERAYNTPQQQAQRAAEAGLNPLAAVGQGSAVDATFAAPQATPSVQPSAAPTPPYASTSSPTDMVGLIGSLFKDLTSGISDVGGFVKNTAETKTINDTRDLILKNLSLDASGKELVNSLNNEELIVKQATRGDRLKEQMWKVRTLQAQVALMNEQGNTEVQKQLDLEQARYEKMARRNLTNEQYLYWQLENRNYDVKFDAYMKNLRSQTNKNDADAEKARSSARLNSVNASLSELRLSTEKDPAVREARKQEVVATVKKLVADKVLSERKSAELDQLVVRLEKSNDWYEVDKIFGMLDRVAGRVIDGYRAATFQSIADGRHVQEEWERDHYGDTVETVTFDGYDPVSKKHKTQSYSHRRPPK